MASFQNFRSAFNGFNREDVVRYIELINNKHNAEINQLHTEMQTLYADMEYYRNCCEESAQLPAMLEAEQRRVAELEQEVAALQEQLRNRPHVDSELETYRRAERAERAANERVGQLYAQMNGVLADATARTDDTTSRLIRMAEQVSTQLSVFRDALAEGSNELRDTAAAMYNIKPISFDK